LHHSASSSLAVKKDINRNAKSDSNNLVISSAALSYRGGACSDSTLSLLSKVGLGTIVEAILLFATTQFAACSETLLNFDQLSLTRFVQVIELLCVIFGSSQFGAIVDSGLSAATKQFLDPNTIPGDADWYANLKKPFWNPPGWLFPIMWLIVSKPTQFMAVYKLITQHSDKGKELSIALAVYVTHLSLGDAWNKVFFGLECTGRGLVVICTFLSMLLFSAKLFYDIDEAAGLLMLPTCAWVTVATLLNGSIYFKNKDEECG